MLPDGEYDRIAPYLVSAVKNYIDIRAAEIDADDTGVVGIISFNFYGKDFKIRIGDRIAQITLERNKTPDLKEVDGLQSIVHLDKVCGSTGISNESTDSVRVKVLQ